MRRRVIVVFGGAAILGCSSTSDGGSGTGGVPAGGGGSDGGGSGGIVECVGNADCCPQFTTMEDCLMKGDPPHTACYWTTVYTVTTPETCELSGPVDKCITGSNASVGATCPPNDPHVYLYQEQPDGTVEVIDHEPCTEPGGEGEVYDATFDWCNPVASTNHPACDCFLE